MNRKIRVLHIGEYVNGGVATYLHSLTDIPDADIENYLCMSEDKSVHDWKIPSKNIFYYSYKRNWYYLLLTTIIVRKKIKEINPDIIYCHSTWAGLITRLPFAFGCNKNAYIIYNAHGWSFLRDTNKVVKKIYAFVEKRLSEYTDVVINVSHNEFIAGKNNGIPERKMTVIYSGIGEEIIDCVEEDIWPTGKVRLLYVGRFDLPKGLDYLLDIINSYIDCPAHLCVIGDNVVFDTRRIEKKNTQNVTFVGWIPHERLSAWYKMCDAVIIPSRWEAFGLVAIEAMKYGKAIIASNRGALPEIIQDKVNGLIFDFDSPNQLRNIIKSFSKSDSIDFSKANIETYKNKYTLSRMIDETKKQYIRLIKLK